MVCRLAEEDERIIFIGSDLGYGTMARFKAKMPDRFFMEGVSEANVVGMAAGLALEGKIVYVNTIATFITRRCFEQIVLDLCLHNVNVRLIGNGGGLVYAPLGPTHEAIEDIAILRAVPRTTIVAPADADEMRRLMPLTVDHTGPIYIRLGKGNDPITDRDGTPLPAGKVPDESGNDALPDHGHHTAARSRGSRTFAERQVSAVLTCPKIAPDTEAIVEHGSVRLSQPRRAYNVGVVALWRKRARPTESPAIQTNRYTGRVSKYGFKQPHGLLWNIR
jgi:transketolase